MRYPVIIGNWKLNGNYQMVSELSAQICRKLINLSNDCIVVIAPPEIYLILAQKAFKGSNIVLGAQNVDIHLSGAFTGETSAKMLKDVGVKYVIIGHSERRFYHKESNKFIAQKFAILKELGLIPVLCIGETEEENISGKTKEVCACQIDAILKTQGAIAFDNAIIAYEPVWAIGTGKTASPTQIQEIHKFIRNYIAKINVEIAENIVIQYGGSVNTLNAANLFAQPDIDGVLVGSAALKAETFTSIVRAAEETRKNKNCYKQLLT